MKTLNLPRPFAAFAIALGVCVSPLTGAVTRAQADEYNIAIRPVDGPSAKSATLICSDETKTACIGQIELYVDGKPVAVAVIVLLMPGNAYFRFRTGDDDLLVGSQHYAHVAVGRVPSKTTRIALAEAASLAPDDSPNSVVHRPVPRNPGTILARLQIDIRPGR